MGNNTYFQAICRTGRVIGSFSSMAIVFSLAIISGYFGIAEAAAPPTPTNLTATMESSRQISLTGTDNATIEANYYAQVPIPCDLTNY